MRQGVCLNSLRLLKGIKRCLQGNRLNDRLGELEELARIRENSTLHVLEGMAKELDELKKDRDELRVCLGNLILPFRALTFTPRRGWLKSRLTSRSFSAS